MRRLEECLELVLESAPLPLEADYRERYVLVASEVQTGVGGLRAVLVKRRTRNPYATNAAQDGQGGETLVAHILDVSHRERGEMVEYVASDAIGLPGNVREEAGGYRITLPRDEGERRGQAVYVEGQSAVLLAMLDQRAQQLQASQQQSILTSHCMH